MAEAKEAAKPAEAAKAVATKPAEADVENEAEGDGDGGKTKFIKPFHRMARLVALNRIKEKYKCNNRVARKLLEEAEALKPDIYETAAKVAGIEPDKAKGPILDWFNNLDINKVAAFIEKIMEIIALIAPLFL